jgi:hypothetical protein
VAEFPLENLAGKPVVRETPPVPPASGGRRFAAFQPLLILLAMFLIPAAVAAAPELRSFSIPAGPAVATLREFAVQSGPDERLFYAAETVEGIVTRAIRGDYTPRAALEAILAGTGLGVALDARTGALLVSAPAAPVRPSPPAAVAKTKGPLARLGGWLGLALATPAALTAAGSLSGVVSNTATGNLLEGSRVEIAHAALRADRWHGALRVSGLPAGTHDDRGVSYHRPRHDARAGDGHGDGSAWTVRFDLTCGIYKLEAFKVTGEREGNAARSPRRRMRQREGRHLDGFLRQPAQHERGRSRDAPAGRRRQPDGRRSPPTASTCAAWIRR